MCCIRYVFLACKKSAKLPYITILNTLVLVLVMVIVNRTLIYIIDVIVAEARNRKGLRAIYIDPNTIRIYYTVSQSMTVC